LKWSEEWGDSTTTTTMTIIIQCMAITNWDQYKFECISSIAPFNRWIPFSFQRVLDYEARNGTVCHQFYCRAGQPNSYWSDNSWFLIQTTLDAWKCVVGRCILCCSEMNWLRQLLLQTSHGIGCCGVFTKVLKSFSDSETPLPCCWTVYLSSTLGSFLRWHRSRNRTSKWRNEATETDTDFLDDSLFLAHAEDVRCPEQLSSSDKTNSDRQTLKNWPMRLNVV
jgi:hypothetical protein